MEEKFVATMILHALGDTIGFKNGEWEFNFNRSIVTFDVTNELLYEFIALGGINNINLNNWFVSDDTILHIHVAKALLQIKDKAGKIQFSSDVRKIFRLEFVKALEKMEADKHAGLNRAPGFATIKYVSFMRQDKDGINLSYDRSTGGNGAAMRACCIGLAFSGEKNRELLIDMAIQTSKMTHNCAIGYLGGLVAALFTAYAIEEIEVYKWPMLLIDLLKSEQVSKYVSSNDEKADYDLFLGYWITYVNTRFTNDSPKTSKSFYNLIFRMKYHFEYFTTKGTNDIGVIGQSGYGAVIMAYDALITAGNVWEQLIIYAAIHLGDGDTVASIACAWYGALYGTGNVPLQNLKYLEYKDTLVELGKKIYSKYYSK